jgi:hypothetical protein
VTVIARVSELVILEWIGGFANAIKISEKIFELFGKRHKNPASAPNSECTVAALPPVRPKRHADEVADRLNHLIGLIRRRYPDLTYPELVEHLGYENARVWEEIANGEAPPNLKTLDDIASKLGASPRWLKFGEYQPFSIREHIDIRNGYIEIIKNESPKHVDIIRSQGECGNVIFAFQYDKYRYKLFDPHIQLAGCLDASDCMHLYDFFKFLIAVRDEYNWGHRLGCVVFGRSISEDIFSQLVSGKTYPAEIIDSSHVCNWCDDFLDIRWKYFDINHYTDFYGKPFVMAQMSIRSFIDFYLSDDGTKSDYPYSTTNENRQISTP